MFSMMSVFGIGFLSATPMNAKDLRWDCKTPYYPLGQQSGWNYCDGREIAPAPKKEVAKPVPAAATPVAPADSDKDGVIDSKDTCPGTPAGVQVYANGCPTDTDKDGVPDYMDECQGTAEGTAVDAVGCPQTAKAIKDEGILKGVQFESGSAKLLPESKKILDEAAEILNTRNRVRAEIQGHTDNQGKPEANMTLSQRRAESVKAYLVSKGVAADRLEAKGFGQTKPLADNNTADGRSQNRRIEFKVLSR
ncbi:MAG: hypothetical protein KCHDKBKB_02073 [Elusimicrobia bacterium]|nr:hypothetical protein [Elusimicrobiota bacterium]